MCGLAGMIGKSKHPNISFQIATKLFERSESRGTDASGFWGCQAGDNGSVVFHKEPRRASQFVHGDPWKRLKKMNLNLLIMHARASSQGVGDAKINKNNHPFTNADKSVGLVHNGRIFEYSTLKKRYEVKSDCDSEILLRIFETARNSPHEEIPGEILEEIKPSDDIVSSMNGIREIFSYVNDSPMATAIGERSEGGRRDLWLFHNEKRPLWVIDARDVLGQVFFCSLPEIWSLALRDCPQAMGMLGGRRHTIVPMPTEEIWYLSVDDQHPVIEGQGQGYYAFRLDGENEYTPWDDAGPNLPILPATRKITILSDLGEHDEITTETVYPTQSRHQRRHQNKVQYEDRRTQGVIFRKDGGACYDDELVEITDPYDDTPPDDDEDEENRYHGMTPLRFNEDHQLIPAEKHIGTIIDRRLERQYAMGYDTTLNDNSANENENFDIVGLERTIRDIVQQAHDIETTSLNMAQEGSLTPQMFQDNLDSLNSILLDLQGSQKLLEGH